MFYIYSILGLALLGIIAAVAHYARERRYRQKVESGEMAEEDIPAEVNPVDMECCGQHEVCEKESLLAAVSKQIEYFDDEELDRYRGREADEYTEEETEEFRDVLYTMKTDEVAGWVRSLQLRQVALPDDLKDEVFLIVGERRGMGT